MQVSLCICGLFGSR